MTLDDYALILRRYWLAIAAFVTAAVLVAFGVSLTMPKVYTADASGFVTAESDGNAGMAMVIDSLAKSRATSYVELAKTRAVADRVIENLGLDTTSTALVNRITATVPTDTVTLRISATAPTAQEAQDLANAWIVALAAQIEELETGAGTTDSQTGEATAGTAAVTLVPQETAVLPSSPTSPNTKLNVALGLLVGLALGVGYAVLRNVLDKRIRSSEQVERELELPVIGTLPLDQKLRTDKSRLISSTRATAGNPHLALAEALRELRTNIQFLDVDHPPRRIVITSPAPGEGKSTVAANLALTLAEAGARTVLVDADLRRPTVATTFGLTSTAGLTDVIAGTASLADVIHRSQRHSSLYVLPAGTVPPNPSELLASEAVNDLLSELAERAIVILDSPPLLPVTDAAILTARNSGALVVISAGRTTVDELGKAMDNVHKVSGRVLGVIINRVPVKGADRGRYGYYAGNYSYTKEASSHAAARE